MSYYEYEWRKCQRKQVLIRELEVALVDTRHEEKRQGEVIKQSRRTCERRR